MMLDAQYVIKHQASSVTPSRPARQLGQPAQRCAQGWVQAEINLAVELIIDLLGRRVRVEGFACASHCCGSRARVIIPSGRHCRKHARAQTRRLEISGPRHAPAGPVGDDLTP